MQLPERPADDSQRLDELRRYGVLDTEPEERFDRLTRLVAAQLDVPIALISLVDRERQWFKAGVGLDCRETSRDVSFCAHAILSERILVVSNASEDARFSDNPLVTGGPRIRFYAGMPLVNPRGFRLGTLCAVDTRPRQLSDRERQLMETLARVVVDELELSWSLRAYEERTRQLESRTAELVDFGRAMSHDLSAPIRQVRMLVDWLEEGDAMPVEECLSRLRGCAETASSLVAGLRSFLLTEPEEERGGDALGAGARRALERLATGIEQAEAAVTLADLPNIDGDTETFAAVFEALFDNALKYRGEATPSLEVLCDTLDDAVRVTVRDNGIGIDPQHHDRVFDALFRLHSNSQVPGSGLGLAHARKLLRRLGGRIWLESTPGDGTAVHFTVPRDVALRQPRGPQVDALSD